jgi:hypothetical protein
MGYTFVPVSIADATTYSVKSRDAGVTHYIPDFTSSCTITLPSPKAGLWFEFVYAGGAADAQNAVLSTGSDTNYFTGGVLHMDTNAGAGTDELVPVFPDGNSNSKLTMTTPNAGTRVKVESVNGTTWVITGQVASDTAPAFADQ